MRPCGSCPASAFDETWCGPLDEASDKAAAIVDLCELAPFSVRSEPGAVMHPCVDATGCVAPTRH